VLRERVKVCVDKQEQKADNIQCSADREQTSIRQSKGKGVETESRQRADREQTESRQRADREQTR
jgi:hypothetical protein